jgi:cell division protein ZapA
MPQVEIMVNDRAYKIACAEGEEERLVKLADYFDRQVRRLAGDLGQIGDQRLFLLAALTACDDLHEARARLDELTRNETPLDEGTLGGATRVIDAAARRIEGMAARVGAA